MTLGTRLNLGLVLDGLGKSDEAARVYRELVEVQRRVLGPEHRDTLMSAMQLAGAQLNAGCYDEAEARGIAVQHILYDPEDARHLDRVLPGGLGPDTQLIFVLGRYVAGQVSEPAMIAPFLGWLDGRAADWAVCAFWQGETACLRATAEAGGKLRVGFENSLLHEDGSMAEDNADRVRAVAGFLPAL